MSLDVVGWDWAPESGFAPLPAEEWRLVAEGTHEVSTFGRVRRAVPGISTFVGRIVKPVQGPTGYAQCTIGSRRVYVHRLVMEVWVGPCPAGHVVNHRDLNRQNNTLANLEYVTWADNALHSFEAQGRKRGPCKPKHAPKGKQIGDAHWSRRMPERIARGDRMPHTKLTSSLVSKARSRVASGEKQKDVAASMGVSVATMSRVIRGKRWV